MQMKQLQFLQAADRSKNVLNSIKSTIIDLIQKLNDMEPEPAIDNIIMKAPNLMLLEVLRLSPCSFSPTAAVSWVRNNFILFMVRYLDLSCKWV